MDIIFRLLDNPLVLWGLVLVALFVGYQKLASRVRVRVPGFSLTPDELVAKLLGPRYLDAKLDRKVAGEKKRGNYLAAGRMYEDAGKAAQAIEAYLEGQEHHAAATVLESTGKRERAAELYLQAGDYKKAAQVFTEAGKPARAAELFLERNNTIEAARLYGVAQMWGRAAELYLKGGFPLRAAEAFEKNGDFLRAAECHARHFDENVTYATTYSATAQSADHKSALLAGRLFEKAGDTKRAFQAYSKGSYFKEAAAACMHLGDFARAAELFLRAEDPESAATAWERGGDPVRAAHLRGEVAVKSDRVPEAAAYFVKGQDYLRAAELYESVGMLAEAAGAFEAGDSHAAAGGVYLRAGLKERAAHSYERAGEYETAAKLFEETGATHRATDLYARAGLTFKSGEAAAKAGERDKAIALLQRVGPGDENYRAATELLAGLFIEAGLPALGIERVAKTLGNEPVSGANLELYYWLAAAHDAAGHAAEALALYKKVQAEDLNFRDVPARVARLQAHAGAAPARGPAAGGAPQATARPAAPATVAPPPAPASVAAPGAASATPAQATPPAPRFQAREVLGRGPLGPLHRGEDTSGRPVSLRLLAPEIVAAPAALQQLVADLKAVARLNHAGLARVLGLVDIDGRRAVVGEWLAGRTLGDVLGKGQRLAFGQALTLARLMFQALGALHEAGLVHGAIQPSNVLLAGGAVKLVDLGTGRLRSRFPGTHRAPGGGFDRTGDLYAAAAVVYHVLTGLEPGLQSQGVGLPLPSSRAAGVPEAFDSLLLRSLHPRAELRPASAADVLVALQGVGSGA